MDNEKRYNYLLTPSGKAFPHINYYEIGNAAKQIVEIKINENEEIKNKFEEFSKDYTHFEPYFDFLIYHLGFKLNNPEFMNIGQIIRKNDHLGDAERTYVRYPLVSDKRLKINHVDVTNLSDCLIDINGNCYNLDRNKGLDGLSDIHQQICEIILIEKMINNKKLYEDFKYWAKNKKAMTINSYMRNRLGYLQVVVYDDRTGHIIYNPDLVTDYVANMLNDIQDNYPDIELLPLAYHHDTEINQLKNEMSDLYESRRI